MFRRTKNLGNEINVLKSLCYFMNYTEATIKCGEISLKCGAAISLNCLICGKLVNSTARVRQIFAKCAQ